METNLRTQRTTILADRLSELQQRARRMAAELADAQLPPGQRLEIAFAIGELALDLRAIQEEVRMLNRPSTKRAALAVTNAA